MKDGPDQRLATDDARWQSVLAHDADADGHFVYAVTSTGVYCRPSCPSRRPARERVRFFRLAEAAEAAGFRACKRCRPKEAAAADPGLAAVGRALASIEAADDGIPTLKQLGEAANLSPGHLQRLFTEVVGLSPRRYAEARRLQRLKGGLRQGNGVADALYGAGYGSSSRLYEKAGPQLGMTPASYARGGRGADIAYATRPSPLGRLLVAATEKGVCLVALGNDDGTLAGELAAEFPAARIRADGKDGRLAGHLDAVLELLSGALPSRALPLDVRATAFQWRVWRALSEIPMGETRTYGEIAAALGSPKAARAVGRACATNPVAVVIPCHRALGAGGRLTGYRWGKARKHALLAREAGSEAKAKTGT